MKPFPKMLASLSRPLALIALTLSLLGSAVFVTPAWAATFTVTKTADTNDGVCDADCSLREAISAANAAAGVDTVTIPAGTYQLTLANAGGVNEDNNVTGDLDILDSISINGAGSGSTIIQAGTNTTNGIDKVIAANPFCTAGVNVSISGVTVRFGRNTQPSGAPDFSFTGGGIDWCAGGTGGTFTLNNSVVSDNTNVNGYGGGLNVDSAVGTSTVNILNVTFSNNQTLSTTQTATGGAINLFGDQPSILITNSTFTGNQTAGPTTGGGAIYFRPTTVGHLTINGSTFTSNTAGGIGGAIATDSHGASTTISIQTSTFTGNTATNSFGGALKLDGTNLNTTPFSLTHLKITGNTAGISGGGIFVGNSNVTMSQSLIVGNNAPTGKGLHRSVDAGTVTVTNNWWGCSTGPGAAPCDTASTAGGTLNFTPWYRNQLTASTSPIVTNQSTSLTASFLTNSNGTAVPVADLAEIIGRSVTWAATLGNLSSTQGTVQAAGTATGSFQATAAGTAIISAKVDNDNTSPVSSNVLSLTVNKANTTAAITNGATLSSTPSVTGQPVTVNFSVTGAFGNSPTAPTGNVTVSDGTDSCTGTVSAGTCDLTFKTAGAKTLTATYAGDTNFNTSPASASASHTVNKADTTTTITSDSPDPSVTGQTVTFNVTVAAVAPGAAVAPTTITGTVVVSDGGTNTCNVTLTAGAGSCTIAFPSTGSYSMTGAYGGDANFNGSTSAANSHTVNKADTTTTITSDNPDPSDVGQAVTVNYSVTVNSPGAGTPTGNVTVSDGVDSCTGTVAAGTCDITLTTVGSRTLTATYAGDSNFNGSISTGTPHSVNKINTTTAITSDSPDPSVVGQAVTVQYTVTPASGSSTPTGNVTVSDGTVSCTATVAAGQCSLTFTSAGAKSLTATYAGDSNFNGSTSAAEAHQVNAATTTTTITSDNPDPSVVGQSVTVQYNVSPVAPGDGTPTGNVTVSDGTVSCTGTVAAGQCSLTFTSAGAKSLTATYAGDSNFNGSTSAAESHQVDKADTTTTITSDNPDPSNAGQAVTVQYSVSVNAPGAGTPTGNVTVSDGVDSCTGTVAAGTCNITLTTSGARTLTATYPGDSNFNGSLSAGEPHTVNGTPTTTTITSDSPDPSVVGQSVTVQYSVTSGSGTPTGNVTVSDGTTSCTATVAAGQCSLTFTSAGAKSLTATYAGDSNFSGSTSAAESHQVNPADTTTTIASDNPDPSVVGQSVTVQFSVIANAPGSGTLTGNVTVSDGTISCTGTVSAGQCSLTFTSTGAKSLTATYAGDSNFNGSTSAAESHQVDKADTITTITSDNPDPSTVGQAVTVQYSVSVNAPGAGTSTGNVTVSDGTVSCTGTVAAGQCSLTFTSAGAKSLTATYAGDSNFNGSTSAAEPHTVNGTPTTTTITADNPDPSVVGQSVTVQYSVTSGSGTPTGNVTVSDGTVSCTATVTDGQCSLTFTSAGAKSLTATYAGDSTFSGSTSAAEAHQVNKADTTTTITSDSPDPSTQGSAVTVHYSVAATAPGAGTPTGNVTVTDGVDSCTGTVAAGQCSITLTTLGSRTLTATYAGDSNFNGSTSAGESHTVNPANSAPTATVSGGQCSGSNMASGTINLTLFDADGNPLTLTLASNSNTSLVKNSNIVIGGSGNARTITVTGTSKKSGTATLTFNLSDGTTTVPVVVTVKIGTDKSETLNGTSGIDMIFGLNGTNTINGNAGNDLLCGGNGTDTLNGGDGNDILDGENGNDVLNGGNGNDILRGNQGDDTLTGGAGADFFSGGMGTDTATDFNAGQGDTQDGTIP
ncbi:MAG TPA: Ig-like domain repeat protein [Anaerolineales bacterium]|nr:Ig-like domain repeat protein [Anaerolineales bacterium]